jgi:hypothetical protein
MKKSIDVDNPWVCWECGGEYMKEQNIPVEEDVHTYHNGICKVCHQQKSVTHERNWKWLYKWQN